MLSLKLVMASVYPVTASNCSDVKVRSLAMIKRADDLPVQVRGKGGKKEQAPETFTTVSRRDIATIILPEPAEARILNPEVKRKIFEKLKMLREKVGLAKQDTEDEKKTISPFPVPTKESPLAFHVIRDLEYLCNLYQDAPGFTLNNLVS